MGDGFPGFFENMPGSDHKRAAAVMYLRKEAGQGLLLFLSSC
jgi:hypothetical protein